MSDDGRPLRSSLAGICPVCGAPLDLNSSACRRCGVTPKRVGLCVHCKSTSSVRPHPELGWVCEVCGGTRLAHPALEQDASVRVPLAAATREYRWARVLRTASGFGAVFTIISLFFLLLLRAVFSPSGATLTILALMPVLLAAATIASFLYAKSLRARTTVALEQAQTAALVKLLADFPEGALASQLASSLQISHSRAEQLLTRLNVRDDIQSMVADDGQLLFRIRQADDLLPEPFASRATGRVRLPAEADYLGSSLPDASQRAPTEPGSDPAAADGNQEQVDGTRTEKAR